MQRVPKYGLLVIFAIALNACGEKEKHMTTSDYLHDMDTAKAMVQKSKTDYAKYQNDPNAINASAALAQTITDNKLQKCWHDKETTTANTDHVCLDNLGYKRGI